MPDPATRAVPGPGRARYARRAGALNRKRRGKTLFVQSWPVRRCRPAWRASHTAPDPDRTDGRHRHARNLTAADRGGGAGAVRHDGYFRYVKGGAGDTDGAKRAKGRARWWVTGDVAGAAPRRAQGPAAQGPAAQGPAAQGPAAQGPPRADQRHGGHPPCADRPTYADRAAYAEVLVVAWPSGAASQTVKRRGRPVRGGRVRDWGSAVVCSETTWRGEPP
jgi:hypothetical protein